MAHTRDKHHYDMLDQQDVDPAGDEEFVSKAEKQKLTRLSQDAFKQSAAAMSQAELGKTEKFLGMRVDSGLAAYLSSIYNIASDNIGQFLIPKTYKLTTSLGTKAGLHGTPLERTAAATTFAVTAGLKSAADIGKIRAGITEQREERKKLVHEIAPVLDDIKGRHSLSSLSAVREEDNEVIYAHRQRLSKIARSKNSNNLIGMVVNVAPNLALDVTHFGKMWAGKTPAEIKQEHNQKLLDDKQKNPADMDNNDTFKHLGRTMVQATTGQVADRIVRSNEFKLKNGMQPYSALDMILELQQQVESNPKASSFQVPKAFGSSGRHRQSYPLEEYVGLIFLQHQKDMADLKEDHTEIREALHEDLEAAVKPIAAAIRKGDLSVMSLVRLVGEQKIIKNRGRAIAEPEEVKALIEGSTAYVHTDLKEYYKNSPHGREGIKKPLETLKGEDRMVYLSLLPLAVRKDLGVSDKENKDVEKRIKTDINRMLSDLTVGIHAEESEAELKKDGLAKPEMKELQKAYDAIEKSGEEAMDKFKSSPANPKGIERTLSNWAVSRINGGKVHLGKVMEVGHSKVEAMASEEADVETHGAKSFAKRETHRGGAYPEEFSLN